MTEEVWRDIKGYENLYQVSNLGRVRSLDRWVKCKNGSVTQFKGRIVAACNDKHGYKVLNLWKDNKFKQKKVHQLIAQAFIPNPENKPYIDHINTIKHDNTVVLNEDGSVNYEKTNIRWVTAKENMNNPTTKINLGNGQRGKKQSSETIEKRVSKLRGRKRSFIPHPKQWVPVVQFTLDNKPLKIWDSITHAQNELGIRHITSACCGEYKSSGGYKWKYLNDYLADLLEEIQDEDMAKEKAA